jgi:hypothetical protein
MRKTIIKITIIVLLLISYTNFTCIAQPSNTWNLMNREDKIKYLISTISTIQMFIHKLAHYGPDEKAYLRDENKYTTFIEDILYIYETFTASGREQKETVKLLEKYVKTINDLYKDQDNKYISTPNIFLVASRKIRGDPFKSLLIDLRKEVSQ